MIRNIKKSLLLAVCCIIATCTLAQTPIANRVKAAAGKLPKGAALIARYTDSPRHCLYFTNQNRLYRLDVIRDKTDDINFASEGYDKIISTFLGERGRYLFVTVDRRSMASDYQQDGRQLWCIDTKTQEVSKVGEGYKIEIKNNRIIITQKDKMRTYDMAGHAISPVDEFDMK
ncbi:hypothetical protein [Prevotella sp. kh1p2]|uniref:hypothetical protein n=1 Tax=Prevotella sp. kh1p2 TaxID=1761883 RepID=UPI0008D73804|nr:hypothetical protein [Prevotella sp. kh1p2]SES98676.1 hypothetical protein SAMN04487825_11022 [Prevotella sp. kh1p2]